METQKDAFKRQFLVEARDILDAVGEATLAAEADPANVDLLNAIFRGVHTIKGSAAMFDMDGLGDVAHELESLLNHLRDGTTAMTPEVADVVLKGLDALGAIHSALVRGETPARDADFLADFRRLVDSLLPPRPAEPGEAAAPADPAAGACVFGEASPALAEGFGEEIAAALAAAGDAQARAFCVRPAHTSELLANGFDPQIFLKNLKEASLLYRARTEDSVPVCGDFSPLALYLRPSVLVVTRQSAAEIRELALEPSLVDVADIARPGEPGPVPQATPTATGGYKPLGRILVEEQKITENDLNQALAKQAAGRQAEAASQAELKVMRVDEAKIDAFNNMIGELVIARNTYDFLVEGLDGSQALDTGETKRLKDNLRLFSRITGELQRGVLALRLVPIRGIFQKYVRVVRDISRKQGKRIDYRMEGGETEIDKKIADLLSEPLIHMIRNACDHGLETPGERQAAGKPETGCLRVSASREGRTLTITIRDDGRGIDRAKVAAKASRLGMDPGDPDDPHFLDVLFLPGFSTREEVSALSGRGVGMDVVKSSLEALCGSVRVESELGRGTSVILSIPMSMGVSLALQVEAGGQPYAIPIDHVLETILAPGADIHDIGGVMGIPYRGGILPVARLDRLLAGEGSSPPAPESVDREYPLVVVEGAKGKYGLVVDRLLRNCEIAIKPVPESLAGLDFLDGVTILGDGRVLLVLNPEQLV